MNPVVKKEWVAALRSGEYSQGKNVLNQNGKFCCWGVLCDLILWGDLRIYPQKHKQNLSKKVTSYYEYKAQIQASS